MLGAYTGYVVSDSGGLAALCGVHLDHSLAEYASSWLRHLSFSWRGARIEIDIGLAVTILAAFVVVGFVGYVLERGLIHFLYGRPLDTLLATWGVGLMLQQLVRLRFGADLKPLTLPAGLGGDAVLGGATIPYRNLFVIAVTVATLALVYVGFFRTRFGLKGRAVTQNRQMASAIGISTRKVDALTFAFGSGLAGVAGCMVGHMYNVTPDMGMDYIVDAFMVVILGGMGRLSGTVLGGLVVGLTTSVLVKLFINSFASALRFQFPIWIEEVAQPMAHVAVLLMVIGFIMVRPSGLLALKERVYE